MTDETELASMHEAANTALMLDQAISAKIRDALYEMLRGHNHNQGDANVSMMAMEIIDTVVKSVGFTLAIREAVGPVIVTEVQEAVHAAMKEYHAGPTGTGQGRADTRPLKQILTQGCNDA
jgi:hypothetical protein